MDGGVSMDGATCTVSPFVLGRFAFAGGSIPVHIDGTWYVGVEMWSGRLRTLPRLGHTGWIPVAQVVMSAGSAVSVQNIEPVMPVCRIPRTMRKVLAGQAITAIVIGSSLTQSGGGSTDWPGMVLGGGSVDKYKLPTTVSVKLRGVGGAPSQYQLAQLGFASGHTAYGFGDSGFSRAVTNKSAPNGRSALFTGIDLVVIGLLANGGEYRLECIEPLIRQLRKRGIEVIVTTDNPQNPSTDYALMTNAGLYTDGPEVMRVADLYGVELADTAAYVVDAHLRAAGVGIYGDTIHMASGAPTGPAALVPANGHEAWARAVRSCVAVGVSTTAPTVTSTTYDFASGTQGWVPWQATSSTATNVGGALVGTKTAAGSAQWGVKLPLVASPAGGNLAVGDTVRIQGTATLGGGATSIVIGLVNGAWSGTTGGSAGGAFDYTSTANAVSADILFLAQPDSAAAGATITIDNVTVTVTRQASAVAFEAVPGRAAESRPLPPVRVVTDLKTPADAFVILPADELNYTNNNATKGTLGAHPWGSSSFARSWSAAVGASADLLTLTAGKSVFVSADCAVALSLIHYRTEADGAATVDVKYNGVVDKTLNFSAAPFANEWYTTIYTPTEYAAKFGTILGAQGSVELVVTSGTVKVAALVGLVPDMDFLVPEQISFVGPGWLPKEASRSGLPGRPTDTLNDYAVARCTGKRLFWVTSANPGSKQWTGSSGSEVLANQAVVGNYHVRLVGGLNGPGENHTITCVEANASGSQANGHALHVGGAVIINDR